ncbi:hypothetical protein CVD28_24250 [Bacillus sp. M6-12]|nr:hypothetical protein CVD28_24250 [Bacillus sp. M6-12]
MQSVHTDASFLSAWIYLFIIISKPLSLRKQAGIMFFKSFQSIIIKIEEKIINGKMLWIKSKALLPNE